jgi:uncharacterized membrane protein
MHAMWFWWIACFVFFAVVLLFLLSAAGALSRYNESAESILKRRYAAGEVDAEEYRQRLAELSKPRNAA